jgi:site-specific DNA-methyltransferase (adenine-specific)
LIEMPTEAEPVRVVCGDAFEVLRGLPDASVDHTITDPPYAEKTHAGARTRVLTGQGVYDEFAGSTPIVDFDSIDAGQFVTLCRELVRVSRRWVLMTCDWRHLVAAEEQVPEFVRFGVWVKPDAAPQFSGDRPGTGWEAVLMLHRKGKKRWNGGGLPAVWTCNIVKQGNLHRTQKPFPLVRKWVKQFTDPGETILDPFGGSGTTAAAAMREGRLCLTVEQDPAYVSIIRRRLSEAGTLFAGV